MNSGIGKFMRDQELSFVLISVYTEKGNPVTQNHFTELQKTIHDHSLNITPGNSNEHTSSCLTSVGTFEGSMVIENLVPGEENAKQEKIDDLRL